MHRGFAFGVATMLALSLAALVEILGLVLGFFLFGTAFCIIHVHGLCSAPSGMPSAADVTASLLGHCIGSLVFLHRTLTPF